MKHALNRELHAYWDGLRGDAAAPARADIDPVAISRLLNDTFMLGCAGDGGFPIRVAGARICDLFLQVLKDMPFESLFCAEDRASIAAMLGGVIDDPTAVVAGLNTTPSGRETATIEMLLLPLGPLRTPQARVLGALAPVNRPAWVGLIPAPTLRLTSLRILAPLHSPRRAGLEPWATVPIGAVDSVPGSPRKRAQITLYNAGSLEAAPQK